MRSNIDHANIRSPRLLSPAHGTLVYVLSGTFVIPAEGPTLYFLDGGALDRTVFLPVITSRAGQQHWIFNLSITNALNIVDSNGVAVVTIPANGNSVLSSYASGWRALLGATGSSDESALYTSHTVTSNSLVIPATASEVFVNFAGAVTLTLPDTAAWFAAHLKATSHLLIKDISGAGAANNITINRAGADTIDGATSFTITSNYGGVKLRRVAATLWGIVG